MNVYHVQNNFDSEHGGNELNSVVVAESQSRALEISKLKYPDQDPNDWKIKIEISTIREGEYWISSDSWER